MGKAQRDKGARGERQVVQIFKDHGYDAVRTGEWKAEDIHVTIGDDVRVVEVKCRAKGASATLIYEELERSWCVVHKADRKPFLITLEFKDFLELIKELNKPDIGEIKVASWAFEDPVPDGKDGGSTG